MVRAAVPAISTRILERFNKKYYLGDKLALPFVLSLS
jgi:hypothetical protein